MNPYEEHAEGLEELGGEQEQFITWKRKQIPIVPGTAARRSDLSVGGFSPFADFHFEALVADFGYEDVAALEADLTSGTIVGYLGKGYRPETCQIRPGGLQIGVDCKDANQGA